MDPQAIEDVLNVSGILAQHGYSDAANTPSLIGDLLGWAAQRGEILPPPPPPAAPKAKRGKATESDDSEPTTTPDPSEPDF